MTAKTKVPVIGLTTRHIVYLIVMHTIGAMILDAGINFGLATAMYKNNKHPVYIWPLPNTLAGDMAVTIIIQQALTWILDRLAVRGDLKKGLVAPLRMPSDASSLVRWFVGLKDVKAAGKPGFAFHFKRVVVYIVATFLLYWPITIGVLYGLKSGHVGAAVADGAHAAGEFNLWPFPQIFKAVYSAALGLTTPFVSYVTLIYEGETQAASSGAAAVSAAGDEESKVAN
ncbi:hypothetical protein BG015_002392 [Linnemannia schmuckeri]|uniref:Uncharacterized protein n=1 Tax=Linnemannia schmuckeri TaxID=64567 RepID=A0A9P5RNU6_9FUNG|nr:hypothetical protein BG015_002392 [Linnemannia schmuckeri]